MMFNRRACMVAAGALTAAFTFAGCGNLVPQDLRVPKLYFSDYKVEVNARHTGGTHDLTFASNMTEELQLANNPGLVYSPNYTFVSDPVLLLQMTEPPQLPASEFVDEPYYVDGEPKTRRVLRKPLFYIDKTTVTYTVPGYTIDPVTVTQQLPVKQTQFELELPAAVQVAPIMAAFADNPAGVGAVVGTMTVTVDVRDLDPVAAARSFQVSRTLPLVYRYQPSNPEETVTPPPTPTPTVAPTATPTPAPTVAPDETASS